MFFYNKLSPNEKLHFFHQTYCDRWLDKYFGFVSPPYLGRVGWVVGSPKSVFLDVLSIFKKNAINNLCLFIQDPKKDSFLLFCVFNSDRVELRGAKFYDFIHWDQLFF